MSSKLKKILKRGSFGNMAKEDIMRNQLKGELESGKQKLEYAPKFILIISIGGFVIGITPVIWKKYIQSVSDERISSRYNRLTNHEVEEGKLLRDYVPPNIIQSPLTKPYPKI